MRILAVTTLYPNPFQPHKAPFNREQLRLLAERHAVAVISPIAWTDAMAARRRGYPTLATDRNLNRDGLSVEHPRYYFPPRILRAWYGHCYRASIRRAFRRAVERSRPDIVHAPFAFPDGWAAVRMAHAAGLPAVIQAHGTDVRRLDEFPGRRRRTVQALCEADGVIAVSQELADVIVRIGADPERIRVVYDGVDPDLFRPGSKEDARTTLGRDPHTRQLLYVGRLDPVKALDVLLDACRVLRDGEQEFEVNLVGEGPMRELLTAKARRLGLGDRIHFWGPLPLNQLPDWYRAADVFVLPSRSEGVPNVLLEALACRTPFVATRVGGVPEVAPPTLGQLVPPGDPIALAAALRIELTGSPRDPGLWPAPKHRATAVAEAAEFLQEVVTAHRARQAPAAPSFAGV